MNRRTAIGKFSRLAGAALFTPQLFNIAKGAVLVHPQTIPIATAGGSSSTLLTNLSAYYKMEDVTDSGSNGANLTNHGAVTFVAGKVNSDANFIAASSQYLDVASGASNQFGTGDFSLAFWFKTSQTNPFIQLVNKGGRGANSSWYVELATDQVQGNVTDSGGNQVGFSDATGGSNNNAWHLVVISVTRAGNLIFWLDNVQKTSASMAGATGTVSSATGLEVAGQNGASNLYTGMIGELGLWSKALTSTEATCLWNSSNGTTHPFPGLC